MRETSSRVHLSRLVAAVLTVAIVGGAGLFGATAQTAEPSKSFGASVSVTGSGDAVTAFGGRVTVDGTAARVKAAGAVVDVRGEVEGNVWAAGADVTVTGQIGGSVRASGARVAVRGRIGGDIMLAGALVEVDAAAAGNVRAAGANVRLGPLTSIDGGVSAAGANVGFDGHVAGDARFAGAVVTLNGRADGNVSVIAERLVVGPRAVIGGNLMVRSLSEPQIDPGATISGEISRQRPGKWFDDLPEISLVVVAGGFALSIFLTGVIFLIFARSSLGEAVDHVRFRPLSSVLYGILTVVGVVIFSTLLMATVVGFALGLALLLVLPLVFVLSQPVAAAGIVGWIFGRNVAWLGIGRLLLFLVLGSLVIGFVGIIPITGPWIVLAALIFGVGGLFRAIMWRFRSNGAGDYRFGSDAAGVGRR